MNIAVIFLYSLFGLQQLQEYVHYSYGFAKIAESKGLPSSYMWFGLLGVIGIIIVAVMGPSYPQYPQYPPQNGQNPYQQNTYFEIIHTNSLSNKAVAHTVERLLITILLLAVIVDKC